LSQNSSVIGVVILVTVTTGDVAVAGVRILMMRAGSEHMQRLFRRQALVVSANS